nr:helicase HerA-like domain-containing protein [Streptomyces sp. 3330]
MSARGARPYPLSPQPALNRRRRVTGATGTGRTRTLQLIAERLSAQGGPVSSPTPRAICPGSRRPGRRATGCGRAAEEGGRQPHLG